ncbi:three-Cys-motif partner protein TcmP [Flavobacterium sp. 20NA77.7]|uniref:Three-Cys-motif partner protein TcmP n=1 Tax=Flavobacterium nakdongensis TaxID=3073563 RepID=A0ABY9R8L8_9FLAO|nr:three-Cys-motif partner protein TcmP [Flavobacterium sp. 20NA77.7]WMW77311.1 three-Cys-motif partner protein TcmP [Flavobacterium sp. 20NA77.7]
MAKKDSQKIMLVHSEVKVKLLETYLKRYFNILNNSKFIGDIHYFDLFSAEGVYENGGKGSPIIVLDSIKNAYYAAKHKNGNSGKFHCMFNDIEESKIETLKKNISNLKLHYSEFGNIEFLTKDYQILVPEVSKKLDKLPKKEKAFVFIDPYGYKEVRISDIKSLLKNGNSEVLLFLPTHFMFRFIEDGTPESLYEFIEEIVPKEQWPKSQTGLVFIENLKNGFKKYLGKNFFVDTFVISREKNQFFCLFFFTSHIYGFDRMLDAKWELDEEQGRGWRYSSGVEDLFSCVEIEPSTEKFEDTLRSFIGLKSRNNKEIYEYTLRCGHLPSHASQILKKWQENKELISKTPSGENGRKSAFYLSYKEYKPAEPIKLIFSFNNI